MSTILDGSFISDGTQFNLSLPSDYTEFRMVNVTDVGDAGATTQVMRAYATSLMAPGSAYLNLKTNGAATLQLESMITTAGFTYFSNANPPTFAQFPVTAVTAASPAVITTTGAPGFVVGDTIRLTSLNGTMQPMNGLLYTIDAVGGANTFTITFNAAVTATNLVGTTPATAGFAQKVIPSYFSPHNVVLGPTAKISATAGGGVTIVDASNLLLNMNTVPSLNQGASQYSPFQRPYQVGAKLRLYIPTGFNTPQTANFIYVQIVAINTQTGYATPNQLQVKILPGNLIGSITTAAGLAIMGYPAGAAGFKKSFPFVTDVAEVPNIFSEAEDNTGIRGITIGTGVQTTGKQYQWFARKGYSI